MLFRSMGELERLSHELDLAWPRFSDASRVEIERFLRADLRHHRFALEDVEVRPDVAEWIRSAYLALLAATREGDPSEMLDEVSKKLDEGDAVFGPLLAEWASQGDAAAALRDQLEQHQRVLAAKDEELQGLQTDLVEAAVRDAALQHELAEAAERGTALQHGLAEAAEGGTALQNELSLRSREVEAARAEAENLRSRSLDFEQALHHEGAVREREAAARERETARLEAEIQRLLEIHEQELARLEAEVSWLAEARETAARERETVRLEAEIHEQELARLEAEVSWLAEARARETAARERETVRLEAEVQRLTHAQERELARLETEVQRLGEARDRENARLEEDFHRLTAVHNAEVALLREELERLEDELARRIDEARRSEDLLRRPPRASRSIRQFLRWTLWPSRKSLTWVREYLALRRSGAFDAGFYLLEYPDEIGRAHV